MTELEYLFNKSCTIDSKAKTITIPITDQLRADIISTLEQGIFLKDLLLQEHKEIPSLSLAEKIILENIEPDYQWMAKDYNGDIFIYTGKPYKREKIWTPIDIGSGYLCINKLFPNLFQFCNWEDEEPIYIPNLLKNCKVVAK